MTTKERSDVSLQPAVDWLAKAERGALGKLQAAMEEASGEKFVRQTFYRWLNANASERIQPPHGTAVLILECVAKLKGEKVKAKGKRNAGSNKKPTPRNRGKSGSRSKVSKPRA